jgi:hypothetical protein
MSDTINRYIGRAKAVLDGNWTGSYTVPARGLYPHQWNWDSGFIAMGYSWYDTGRAVKEITSLFRAQWKNGMLPQIVFNEGKLGTYFPEPDFWQAERSPNAPEGALTSGITMPPIHAVAALRIYENARRKEKVIPFLEWLYPRLLAFHRYLYRERDPDGTGLVYIRHPWESGMDNSPMWDRVFETMDLRGVEIPPYRRRDLSHGVKAEMRPGEKDYDRFVYLVDLFRRNRYDEKAIRGQCPFLVSDPLFNAILCASDEALVKVAGILGEPYGEQAEWHGMTRRAISERLFHVEHGMFEFFNLTDGRLMEVDTAAGFMPLFAGAATPEQAGVLFNRLDSMSFCALHQGNCFTVPNYDTRKEGFERVNYWRGPVWININWLLMKGLRRYGYHQKADSVAKDILQLPPRFGFHEYYDSFSGMGYGSGDFSWTAALFIDTAYENYWMTGERPLLERLGKKLWRGVLLNEGRETTDVPEERLSQEMLSGIKDIKARYYTARGTVDYEAVRKSGEYQQYKRLTNSLRTFDPGHLKDESEKLAFWINLYNSIVVDGIITLGIRSSVKEVMGFFSKIKYEIGGYGFSPDDMEHGILRKNSRPPGFPFRQFGLFDPRKEFAAGGLDLRVHFALVCGSRSCAPIKFYTPERIHEELEQAAVNFVNSSEVIALPEEGRLIISMIFKWYKEDFGGKEGILGFLERYLVDDDKKEFIAKERGSIKMDYLYYDWNLNT